MTPDLEILRTNLGEIAGKAHSASQLVQIVMTGKIEDEDLTVGQKANIKAKGIGLIQDIRDAMVIIEGELS